MDANLSVTLPGPEANDSNDVQRALAAAQEAWAQDPREALRFLRQAAETAADAGDVLRSVHLARAAADLRERANIQASLPPVAPAGATGVQLPPQPSSPVNLVGGAAAAYQNPAQTVPATPAAAAAAALQQASKAAQHVPAVDPAAAQQIAAAQYAAQQAAAREAAAREAAAAQQAALVQQAAAEAAARAAAEQEAARAAAEQSASWSSDLSNSQEIAPVSTPPSAPHFVTHRTVRVALSPAPTGAGQFAIHPLGEGETPEPGWREALLVALDPSERLFPGRG